MTTAERGKLQYHYGTGKRKAAIAQVRIYVGGGQVVVNGKPLEQVLPWMGWQKTVLEPLEVTGTRGRVRVEAKLHGGGVAAWAGALRHGVARALVVYDESLRPVLRKHGLLTRDARVKERKKVGLHRARRAHQYTKR
ncbi:MAG: 30S ribosomal protein S9 [Chloroflexi bacterium]|nr:30S ribosomal protein S9 [Chloroflexota bacterium]